MQRKIHQTFSVNFTYDVHFCRGLFHLENPLFASLFDLEKGAIRLLFVVDSGVDEAHPNLKKEIDAYCKQYSGLNKRGEVLVVEGGEQVKNRFEWVQMLLEAIESRQIDRHSYLIAIGGGAVLDMAGFAAAIAHRGVRHIRIPTTILSQNDSGVGVKNGINYFGKKNFIGSFAPPVAVLNDFDFLHTLDERDWRAGISEAVKVSLIKDAGFFEWLEFNAQDLANRDEQAMEYLIEVCARLHMDHIAGGDPFELGSSRPLDFGHWAAHKLEQLTDYELRHGEAVAIGIALDVVYSELEGRLTAQESRRVLDLFDQLGFQLFHPELEQLNERGESLLWEGLQEFREHLGGQLTIMLLDRIGVGVEVHAMEQSLVEKAMLRLKQFTPTITPVG